MRIDNYTVFDLETTGLKTGSEIIEIGAAKIRSNKVVQTFETFVRPSAPISYSITMLTGISDCDVADAPSFKEILPEFMKFIGSDVLLGHNVKSFDMRILNALAVKLGVMVENDTLDTLLYARHCICLESYSLSSLCSALGVTNASAHRAVYDAVATHECYQKMKLLPYSENNLHRRMAEKI